MRRFQPECAVAVRHFGDVWSYRYGSLHGLAVADLNGAGGRIHVDDLENRAKP